MLTMTNQGITLTEVLVASALAAVIAIGIATLEGSRAKVEQEVIRQSGVASDQGAVALATIGMAQRITQADRVVINNGTGVFQFRAPVGCMAGVPAPNCFDNAANFGWEQYRLTGGQLRLYTNTGRAAATCRIWPTTSPGSHLRTSISRPHPPTAGCRIIT